MWFVTHTISGDRFYFSNNKPKYTVGRVGTDLELQNDICVSRSHAVFHVVESQGQLHLEVEDMGSKYGTFYNKDIEKNAPLEKGHRVQLKNNDVVRFGRLQNIWKVQHQNFVTVTSALAPEDVSQVSKNIRSVGGKILEQWSSGCTHLTMNAPTVTVKLLHALIDQSHIVTSNYWEDLANAVATKQAQLPKPETYHPDFADAHVDVAPKLQRRSLFNGLTFVFLCRKHYDTYGPIVKAAGGACKEITSGVQKAFLVKNNVIVIQYIPATQTQSSQTINEIAEILQAHSKRIIPEYEIGLAILHCSTEENCNPLHKVPESMPQTVRSSMDLSGNVNTQSLGFELPETNDNFITSTPYDMVPSNATNNSYDKEDYQETMPNIHISETPVDQPKKRKIANILGADSQGSDEEDLFQFNKKSCNRNSEQQDNRNDAHQHPSASEEDHNQSSTVKGRAIKRSMFAGFYEKAQPQNKVMRESSPPPRESENPSTSTNRKRPHIQILGEEDGAGEEDDLFCFGDTQNNKKKREDLQGNDRGEDDDLFAFKESNEKQQPGEQTGQNEDSCDMMPTQKFVVVEKPKPKNNSYVKMPKPKILPRKISAIDWISGSLGKIKIKNENSTAIVKSEQTHVKNDSDGDEFSVNTESNGDPECEVKQEMNGGDDLSMTEDHRKWLESLKDAIEIQEVSLHTNMKMNERSHYRFKQNHNSSENLNGSLRNFKTFVKKYQAPSETTSIQLHLR